MFDNLTHNWLDEALLDKMIHRLKYQDYPNRNYMTEYRIWRNWLAS